MLWTVTDDSPTRFPNLVQLTSAHSTPENEVGVFFLNFIRNEMQTIQIVKYFGYTTAR